MDTEEDFPRRGVEKARPSRKRKQDADLFQVIQKDVKNSMDNKGPNVFPDTCYVVVISPHNKVGFFWSLPKC